MNERNSDHVEKDNLSKEQRARLIRETEDKIRQNPIYQFCVERLAEENAIDSKRKAHRYDPKTMRQYKKAAEKGDSDAMCTIAEMYWKGEEVTKDSEQSSYWFNKAAEAGNSTAMFHLARRHDCIGGLRNSDKDYKKAIYWYKKAAEGGRSDAMNRLGWMYLCGQGVKTNCKNAVKWFRMAAEAGHVNAMDILASNYERGIGITKNYEKAVEWYRKAGQLGHDGAKKRLRKLGELL